jgi:hypothetical protein
MSILQQFAEIDREELAEALAKIDTLQQELAWWQAYAAELTDNLQREAA